MSAQTAGHTDPSEPSAGPGLHENGIRPSTQASTVRDDLTLAENPTPPEPQSVDGDEKEKDSISDDKNISPDDGDDGKEAIGELARQLSREASIASGVAYASPFNAPEGSDLDPNSPTFNARKWTRMLVDLMSQEPDLNPGRTSAVAFRDLSVHGFGSDTDFQKTVGNVVWNAVGMLKQMFNIGQRKIQILEGFDGLLKSGEMLVVLGPPGSGCSTFLKTLAGETHGLYVDEKSYLNYQGISSKQMHSNFRGEAIYTAEVDVHFPSLTVGDTLDFAARARAPRNPPGGVSVGTFSRHIRDVFMATFGISHTINTKVGNDFVRGVSGGERKRVTITEAALSGAPFQCWDNSTRGLDSANAIEFCKTLRNSTELLGSVASVSIYQSPQSAYDVFDKVTVLYEGRQIYFGDSRAAKTFFIDMGFHCPARQTTADFLTSLTSSAEREVRPGFEGQVPHTPDEFAKRWKESETHAQLMRDIDEFDKEHAIGGPSYQKFFQSRRAQQSRLTNPKSPYTLSYYGQVMLCVRRGFMRLRADPSLTLSALIGNSIMAFIISSIFYNLPLTTGSFYQRGALLFFAILLNAFGSALEILTLYAQRAIVEKHSRYAFYHPSAEAFASMLTDMPYKIANAIIFNLILYFMSNLRREPGAFFFFLLISFGATLTMSMLFRTIASVSRTLSQALAPAAVLILAIVIYTGFTIPTRYMLGWSRWISYINPIGYAFESLIINEFHDRNYTCTGYIPAGPGYENVGPLNQACTFVGSKPGQDFVNGDDYMSSNFEYTHAHKWRNFGILIAFMLFLMAAYISAAEFITAKKSKGEVLVFRKGNEPAHLRKPVKEDVEAASGQDKNRTIVRKTTSGAERIEPADMIQRQTAIFHWQDVCYDIKIKGKHRRILDHVDGWVKPGTLTALMGVSGAGKTTLLDVLATRVTMGVVTGDMLVDGRLRDESFQRKTGYVQQQDLHLHTSTVREALEFSAILRQPAHVPRKEKVDYADQVIKLLEMEDYADAVVGVPGEGLNVEQRKRLTIGVELAAKPALLLFLDEPTSGLDSQTSWAICDLMEKLMKNGQAILCTIHQPSAMLFQRFDRLLFLASGGKTVYFGEVGENSSILTDYFEKNGANPCPPDANPAEWMLEVIGAAPGSSTEIDWHATWNGSPEKVQVRNELAQMVRDLPNQTAPSSSSNDKTSYREFAAPFSVQIYEVLIRVFEQYWRTPSYIFSKAGLCIASALFIGFSFFKASNSQQGLQNQMFAVFMLFTIFGQLLQQILPLFVTQRALYEARERPSKAYSWKAFMLANIIVELPWNTLMAVIIYVCWYYPIGLYANAAETNAVTSRGGLMFLFVWTFLLFTSTFANMMIAGIETAETAGNLGNLLFSLTLVFNGVLSSPDLMPRFWIFMYRVSPFNYLCNGILSTGIANAKLVCADNELFHFDPPQGQTCGQYLAPYFSATQTGYLIDDNATSNCRICPQSSTNSFLAQFNYSFDTRWRNFGLMWVYIIFNVFAAVIIYWIARVPKKIKAKENPSTAEISKEANETTSSEEKSG